MADIYDAAELLGVQSAKTLREIRQAWHRRAKTLHPDRNPEPDAAERFKRSHEAYEKIVEFIKHNPGKLPIGVRPAPPPVPAPDPSGATPTEAPPSAPADPNQVVPPPLPPVHGRSAFVASSVPQILDALRAKVRRDGGLPIRGRTTSARSPQGSPHVLPEVEDSPAAAEALPTKNETRVCTASVNGGPTVRSKLRSVAEHLRKLLEKGGNGSIRVADALIDGEDKPQQRVLILKGGVAHVGTQPCELVASYEEFITPKPQRLDPRGLVHPPFRPSKPPAASQTSALTLQSRMPTTEPGCPLPRIVVFSDQAANQLARALAVGAGTIWLPENTALPQNGGWRYGSGCVNIRDGVAYFNGEPCLLVAVSRPG